MDELPEENKEISKKLNRRDRRKLLKKKQRQRRRQKAAKERWEEEEAKRKDQVYRECLKNQIELEESLRLAEEQKHAEEEEAWLRRELIAQQNFRREKKIREAKEAEEELKRQQELKEMTELKEKRKHEKEEMQRLTAQCKNEFELFMDRMEEYIANPDMDISEELNKCLQTRAGAKSCELYERTNCCRFGYTCIFNHRRPLLSRILIIRNFFTHPYLDSTFHFANDDYSLELSEKDVRNDYDEFFYDVVSELETFGKIVNFRTTSNWTACLRGHVFVEYTNERSALMAFVKLQGRYYATKRLNVEFSNIQAWRGSLCGLAISRKCVKGDRHCSYLHIFKNPNNMYNSFLECTKPKLTPAPTPTKMTAISLYNQTPLLSWDDLIKTRKQENSRNWRWSESPELEIATEKHDKEIGSVVTKDKNESTMNEDNKMEQINSEKDEKKAKMEKESDKICYEYGKRHKSVSRSDSRSTNERHSHSRSSSKSHIEKDKSKKRRRGSQERQHKDHQKKERRQRKERSLHRSPKRKKGHKHSRTNAQSSSSDLVNNRHSERK